MGIMKFYAKLTIRTKSMLNQLNWCYIANLVALFFHVYWTKIFLLHPCPCLNLTGDTEELLHQTWLGIRAWTFLSQYHRKVMASTAFSHTLWWKTEGIQRFCQRQWLERRWQMHFSACQAKHFSSACGKFHTSIFYLHSFLCFIAIASKMINTWINGVNNEKGLY